MGKLLFVGTFGTDDPTRASMPFIVASGALDEGHQPTIVLMGEAVYLLKEGVADSVQGIGFPPSAPTPDQDPGKQGADLCLRAVQRGSWSHRERPGRQECQVCRAR
jgi:predicted peroxiredoxin